MIKVKLKFICNTCFYNKILLSVQKTYGNAMVDNGGPALINKVNLYASIINGTELIILLIIGLIDYVNNKELEKITWDTNDGYEDVLGSRDYDGSSMVYPEL